MVIFKNDGDWVFIEQGEANKDHEGILPVTGSVVLENLFFINWRSVLN